MKVQKNFKCKECGDIFTATYDTRNKKVLNYFQCKCGNVEIHVAGVNLFLVNKGKDSIEDLSQQDAAYRTEHYPEDYLSLPKEVKNLMEKAENLGNKINDTNKPGEYYSIVSDENAYFELSGFSTNGEGLEISAKANFFDEYSWSASDPEKALSDFKTSLERFINIEEKVLADEINLNDARGIWDNEDFEWSCSNRTPLQLYDYELRC